jgi:hypothetical protein
MDRGDYGSNKNSRRSAEPHLSVSHRVLLWPKIFRYISESGTAVAVSDMHCISTLGTPWLLKREISEHVANLPCKDGVESLVLGTGSCVFPSLTIQKVKEYSAAYFNTFNVLLPLLDPHTFMDTVVARLLREGYREDDPESVLALLVFALGKLAMGSVFDWPTSGSHRISSGSHGEAFEKPPGLGLFNEARRRTGMVSTKCCLENVQINLLQATYFESSSRHSDFWSSVSAASMACMCLIRGQQIDWSSLNGDFIKRAYWICVFHERLFDLDLKVASTGIESLQDRVPLPHFPRLLKKVKQFGVSAFDDVDTSAADKNHDYAYHFYASIALSRMIRRVDKIVHGYEHVARNEKPGLSWYCNNCSLFATIQWATIDPRERTCAPARVLAGFASTPTTVE